MSILKRSAGADQDIPRKRFKVALENLGNVDEIYVPVIKTDYLASRPSELLHSIFNGNTYCRSIIKPKSVENTRQTKKNLKKNKENNDLAAKFQFIIQKRAKIAEITPLNQPIIENSQIPQE